VRRMGGQRIEITSERLLLFLWGPEDAARLREHAVRNESHFGRWSPPSSGARGTDAYWEGKGSRNRTEAEAGTAFRFAIVWRDEPAGALLGTIALTEVSRGPLQQANLGYGLDELAQGKGVMTEAVHALSSWAFESLRLHRLSANYMPTNERSAEVLRRCGFSVVGYARDYLFIQGAWRDHVLTQLIDPQERPPAQVEG
jgi:[ribosomal protein S5]-alanine N-acetyltransferase